MSEKKSGKCSKCHNEHLVQAKLHVILLLNNSASVGKARDFYLRIVKPQLILFFEAKERKRKITPTIKIKRWWQRFFSRHLIDAALLLNFFLLVVSIQLCDMVLNHSNYIFTGKTFHKWRREALTPIDPIFWGKRKKKEKKPDH